MIGPPPAGFLAGLRAAVLLLTRVPVGRAPLTPRALRWAAAWFPVVGLGIGALGGWVLDGAAPAGGFVAAALAVATVALVTGALHEDGLADTADALGGATSRETIFTILKDSRIGTYGAVALGLSLLVRVGALDRLGPEAPAAFLVAQTLSRLPSVWLMASLPYLTQPEVARSTAVARPGPWPVLMATVLAAILLVSLVQADLTSAGLASRAAVVLPAVFGLCWWRFRARAGGVTGDFLGAAQQVAEVAILVSATFP